LHFFFFFLAAFAALLAFLLAAAWAWPRSPAPANAGGDRDREQTSTIVAQASVCRTGGQSRSTNVVDPRARHMHQWSAIFVRVRQSGAQTGCDRLERGLPAFLDLG